MPKKRSNEQKPTRARAIAELVGGATNQDVVDLTGISYTEVSRIRNTPDVKARIREAQAAAIESAAAKLTAACGEAVNKLINLMRSTTDDAVARNCARDILDRAGLVARAKVEVSGPDDNPIPFANLTFEQLWKLRHGHGGSTDAEGD